MSAALLPQSIATQPNFSFCVLENEVQLRERKIWHVSEGISGQIAQNDALNPCCLHNMRLTFMKGLSCLPVSSFLSVLFSGLIKLLILEDKCPLRRKSQNSGGCVCELSLYMCGGSYRSSPPTNLNWKRGRENIHSLEVKRNIWHSDEIAKGLPHQIKGLMLKLQLQRSVDARHTLPCALRIHRAALTFHMEAQNPFHFSVEFLSCLKRETFSHGPFQKTSPIFNTL